MEDKTASLLMAKFDKILKLAMQGDIDLTNKVKSFSTIQMFDPFDDKALVNARNGLNRYNFLEEVYPKAVVSEMLQAVKEKRNIKPPKCIFIPSKDMVR